MGPWSYGRPSAHEQEGSAPRQWGASARPSSEQRVPDQGGEHRDHLEAHEPALAEVVRLDDAVIDFQGELDRQLAESEELADAEADGKVELVVAVGLPVDGDVRRHADLPVVGQDVLDEVLDVGLVRVRAFRIAGERPPLLGQGPEDPLFAEIERDRRWPRLPLALAERVLGG